MVGGGLRDHDDVAGLEEEVLVLPVRRDDLVVVEGNPLFGRSVEPEDEDPRARGEVGERAGLGENVQDGGPALELVVAGEPDLADHGDLEAMHLAYDDGNLRRGEPGGGHGRDEHGGDHVSTERRHAATTQVQSTCAATLRCRRSTDTTSRPRFGLVRTRMPSTFASGPRVIRTRWPSRRKAYGRAGTPASTIRLMASISPSGTVESRSQRSPRTCTRPRAFRTST